jgi:single-strand DNA-binding protein
MQNIVILAGNIGQTPEVRTTQGGTKITNFSLATSRPRISEGRVLRDWSCPYLTGQSAIEFVL